LYSIARKNIPLHRICKSGFAGGLGTNVVDEFV